jgi:large subunit ribosomal protein L22
MCLGTASAKTIARVSLKHSVAICRRLRGKRLDQAKGWLADLAAHRVNVAGRYHTRAARELLSLLESAEANARSANLMPERLFVKAAKADQGFRFVTPKSRFRFRRRRAKVTRLEIVVEER